MHPDEIREEQELYALLHVLDHAPPTIDAATLATRARAGWTPTAGSSPVSRSFPNRWAAGFLLLALGAATVASAARGSPVREWIGAFAQRLVGASKPSAPVVAPLPSSVDAGGSGIAVLAGRSLLVLIDAQRAATIDITLSRTGDNDLVARATSGGERASFTSDQGRLAISARDSVSLELTVPRDAARVEIRVRGDRVFLKRGVNITARVAADANGRYRIVLR